MRRLIEAVQRAMRRTHLQQLDNAIESEYQAIERLDEEISLLLILQQQHKAAAQVLVRRRQSLSWSAA